MVGPHMLAVCNPDSICTHSVGLMLGIQCGCNVLVQRGPPLAQHVGAMLRQRGYIFM